MKKMLADTAAPTTSSSSDLFFGDFESDCLFCGKECSEQYCSDACEVQDKRSPLTEEEALPALTSANSHSSTSSQCSTPEVSPITKADRSCETDIAIFELGEPVEQLSRSLRSNLNFDYSYKLDASGQRNTKGSPRSLDLRLQGPLHSAYIPGPVSLGKTPTNDALRLRRTPLQNPTQPRKATTNLLSPVLQPANSPHLRPKPKEQRSAPFRLSQPPTRESKRSGGCGKPGCASVAGVSGGVGMVRRASAPLTALRAASSTPSSTHTHEESAIASGSSSDDDEQQETVSRGRSRQLSTYAAADVRGRSHHREVAPRGDRRADSAHAPSDHRGAPICLHKDQCINARPLCGELKKSRSPVHNAVEQTQTIATRSTDGSRTRRQFYGRAIPQADQRRSSISVAFSDSSDDDIDALDFHLGSPVGEQAETSGGSSADGEAEPTASPRRGRRNTSSHLIREAEQRDDASGRGRSKARTSSAAAYRSRSPHRAFSRLRRLS